MALTTQNLQDCLWNVKDGGGDGDRGLGHGQGSDSVVKEHECYCRVLVVLLVPVVMWLRGECYVGGGVSVLILN